MCRVSGNPSTRAAMHQVSAESARHEREAEVQAQRVVYLGQQLERLRSRQAQFENDLEALPVGDSDEVTMLAEGIAEAEAARDVVEGRVAHALDELGLAVDLGYIEKAEVLAVLERRPAHLDVILTGPAMATELMAMADQVTQLRRGL